MTLIHRKNEIPATSPCLSFFTCPPAEFIPIPYNRGARANRRDERGSDTKEVFFAAQSALARRRQEFDWLLRGVTTS